MPRRKKSEKLETPWGNLRDDSDVMYLRGKFADKGFGMAVVGYYRIDFPSAPNPDTSDGGYDITFKATVANVGDGNYGSGLRFAVKSLNCFASVKIDRAGDKTSKEQPFRFWKGDRNRIWPSDIGELENFTTMSANVMIGAYNVVDKGYKLKLKWSGDGAINLFTRWEEKYLTDEKAAERQRRNATWRGVLSAGEDVTITGVAEKFIFEGYSKGKGKLTAVVLDDKYNEIYETEGVWIEIVDIKEMYRYVEVMGGDVEQPHLHTEGSPPVYTTPPEPTPRVQEVKHNGKTYDRNAPALWMKTNDELVFVHGWRMSPEETRQYGERAFKRLWQAGYNGHYTVFRWPCYYPSKMTFNPSEYRAWKCGTPFKEFVSNLSGNKHVISHSQGNIVVGEALAKGLTVDTYTLMQAAVPANSYDASVPEYQDFLTEEAKVDKETPKNMDDLGYGMYLSAVKTNGGRVLNCFNDRDYALVTAVGGLGSWEGNQIWFKPNGGLDTGYGLLDPRLLTYAYNKGVIFPIPIKQRCFLKHALALEHLRSVTHEHESMAFVSRARAQAIGANNYGIFDDWIDLTSKYGFTAADTDHSGQWNGTRPIQKTFGLYEEIRKHIYDERKQQ